VYADVNLDGKVDGTDVALVENSTYFSLAPNAPSKCNVTLGCGRVDVNRDGRVDQLDSTSITQSANLGTNVSCGAIYATAFSCGSTRRAPLTPAVSISFDSIQYFSDDGLMQTGVALDHMVGSRATRDTSLIDNILVEFNHMQTKMEELEDSNSGLQEKVETLEQSREAQAVVDRVQDERLNDNDKVKVSSQSILVDAMISVFVVLVCGILVFIVQKKRQL
jgi:hypothetical protein